MHVNRVKFLLILTAAVVVATPIALLLGGYQPPSLAAAQAQGPSPKRVVAPVTQAPAFVEDPEVLGYWESVDFVHAVEEFVPGKKCWGGDLFLKGIGFKPGGATTGPWQWSRGTLWHPGDLSIAKYEIKPMAGQKYLFMEWISGDVLFRGMKPCYYVLAPSAAGMPEPPQRVVPPVNTPPAFVDDPDALGKWASVNFVDKIEDFVAGQKLPPEELYLKGIEFQANGKTDGPWQWSKGTLWHPGDKSLGHYSIREMDGKKYLFMEWISGDVLLRGMKPCYYVLEKR